jgi:hypothetical protein
MYDPTSPLTAPPPRYRIESDSSDEEGQGAYPSSAHRPGPPLPSVKIALLPVDPADPNPPSVSGAAVIGIGQAGKYLLRRAGGRPIFQVTVGGRPAGMGVAVDGGVVVALQDGPAEAADETVKQIAGVLKASSWYVVPTRELTPGRSSRPTCPACTSPSRGSTSPPTRPSASCPPRRSGVSGTTRQTMSRASQAPSSPR